MKRKRIIGLLAATIAALAIAESASAQVPQLINYQGRLINGSNLVNGSVGLSLRLFNVSSGGTPQYEDSNSVTIVDGLYSTYIGDNTTMGSLTNALTNAAVYVEVAVNDVALSPRERLSSVAYALGVNASGIAGPIADVNLSTNVALLNGNARFSGAICGQCLNIGSSNVFVPGHSSICGGVGNCILSQSDQCFIGGGYRNFIDLSWRGLIVGGQENALFYGWMSAIVGGAYNKLWSDLSFIGGGCSNSVDGYCGTIPGGDQNAAADRCFAAGHRAMATNSGSFVWADSTEADFGTTSSNQFLIRASGGVGIGANVTSGTMLTVAGTVKATAFQGDGSGLTGLNASNITAGSLTSSQLPANVALLNSNQIFSGQNSFATDVGIGTANPAAPLEVSGQIMLNGPAGDLSGKNLSFVVTDGKTLIGRNYAGEEEADFMHEGGGFSFYAMMGTDSPVQLMRLTSNGRVGIGDSAPAEKLVVAGNVKAVRFIGNGSGITNLSATMLAGGTMADARLSTNVALLNANQTFTGQNIFNANVGIGTTAPQAGLHIGNGPQWSSFNVGADLIADGFRNNGIGLLDNNSSNPWAIYNGAGTLQFVTMPPLGDTTTPPSFKMTLTANGNVGIGTANPLLSLQLHGTMGVVSGVGTLSNRPSLAQRIPGEIAGLGVGHSNPLFADDGFLRLSAGGGMDLSAKSFIDLSGSSDLPLMENNIVLGTRGVERMRIGPDGNIGIGVVVPSEKLEVAGNVKAASFIGNGAVAWQIASSTSLTAAPNTGYLITNNSATTTIALPTSPNIGDVIRISSPGSGGWKISQYAGQSVSAGVSAQFSAGDFWTPRGSNWWFCIASSADGNKLVALVDAGLIYTSTDSGATWVPRSTNRYWYSVASSADGNNLVAAAALDKIYTSTDSGATWTPHGTNGSWHSVSVASSSDGNKLVAVEFDGLIYTSTDSGVTWVPRSTNRWWFSVASSSDGNNLVAAERFGRIYTSTDSGATWTPRDGDREWVSVASSADGSKLVAVEYGGQIYTSTDSGATWTPRDGNRKWTSVASSADGSKLVAAAEGGQIYTSTDSGATWTPHDSNRHWLSVALSSDGNKLVAVVHGGHIYTSTPAFGSPGSTTTTAGTGGYLTGGQGTAIELQYIGNGQFMTLSQSGSLYAQ